MKILQVNVVYKTGSTGKIVHDLHNEFIKSGIKSIVCYGRGKNFNDPNIYKVSSEILAKFNALKSRITGVQYNGSFIATKKLINIINKEKPSIVHLHCINGNFVNIYKIIKYLKEKKIKTVLTLHAEFMYTANCGHSLECEKWKSGCGKCPNLWEATKSYFIDNTNRSWIKMKKAFENFEDITIVSVSPWLEKRAIQSPILSDKKHCIILNGIDTSKIFYPRKFEHLKMRHGLNKEKIILHVTADFKSNIKGGKYIMRLAESLKNQDIKIILIGNVDKDLKLADNIIDVGRVEDQNELASYYSMADLTVIASKRETFSMVCAESLSCGTPVVGFKAGAPEQIALHEYSEFVEYGNIEGLEKVVLDWIDKKNIFKNNISSNSIKIYSKKKMYNEYKKLYENILKDRRSI